MRAWVHNKVLAGRGGDATLLDDTAGRGLCVRRAGQEWRQAEVSACGWGGHERCTQSLWRQEKPRNSGRVGDGEEPLCSCGLSLLENAAC